ncbi:syntaxin-125-like [Silene latifolia]|uniref:syntaxin-125-like n=1 Tax=Silene latifolia TaxID=37657 RepID=UPI003D780248
MNNLFSSTFSPHSGNASDLESGSSVIITGANLDNFFQDVETVKQDLTDLDDLQRKLRSAHEETKTAHTSGSVKLLRSTMDRDVKLTLRKAKQIKVRLEALDRSNAANRSQTGCGPGSSTDRTRTSVVAGLREKLKEKMEEFQELRERVNAEYKETVKRRVFTVTGENPDDNTLDLLITTGESESLLQKAIQHQGRGQVLDTIAEIHERHDAVKDIERSLKELHQTFLDMAVLVQAQGEQLDNIEAHVGKASSFIRGGTQQLHTARQHQKNTRKWIVFAIILILVIVLIIVLSLRPWEQKSEPPKSLLLVAEC